MAPSFANTHTRGHMCDGLSAELDERCATLVAKLQVGAPINIFINAAEGQYDFDVWVDLVNRSMAGFSDVIIGDVCMYMQLAYDTNTTNLHAINANCAIHPTNTIPSRNYAIRLQDEPATLRPPHTIAGHVDPPLAPLRRDALFLFSSTTSSQHQSEVHISYDSTFGNQLFEHEEDLSPPMMIQGLLFAMSTLMWRQLTH
jgi:hypothetical protein